jgi:hypothetical protein
MPSCLTQRHEAQVNVLFIDCKICAAFDPNQPPPEPLPILEFRAVWDTGASGTVITQRVADALGLLPTGMVVVHGVHGQKETETFLVNAYLPPNVMFPALRVTKGDLQGFDILIGMDIIGTGDFAVTNVGGKTVLSFRCPSSQEIDFVKDLGAARIKAMIKNRPASQVPRKKKKNRH